MLGSPEDLDPFIEAACAALGLPADPAFKPAIRANLIVALRFGADVAAFALPDDAEPAPIFRA
ncbi:MAG: hypothetical protein JWN71_4261 [Xanthobacteraceae bacterium]|jgi:hypothetical protein|nr:hypothetical protein [Xanthobacteraceae bacterium]